MGNINLLDKTVYNQISAGEVVENPSSIVKELVENSIDAGATEISVSIFDGGIKEITVRDNGCGILREDYEKVFLPHATSKICSAKDLLTIGTLGFRGEAMASIASVSEVCLESRHCSEKNGHSIEVKGGKLDKIVEIPWTEGTEICVRNLFFNTPARYKFLRPQKSEEAIVTRLVTELIFANPSVKFLYEVDGEVIYKTTGISLYENLYSIFNSDIANNLIPFEIENKGYRVTGFCARPATSAIKGNRNNQIFIINGRTVCDVTISNVIQNAYGEHLMKRTFPVVILDMVMPFEMVDVNVHPSKKEVRFADKKTVNGLIYSAIKDALAKDVSLRQQELSEKLSTEFVLEQTNTQSQNIEEKVNNNGYSSASLAYAQKMSNWSSKTLDDLYPEVKNSSPSSEYKLELKDMQIKNECANNDEEKTVNFYDSSELYQKFWSGEENKKTEKNEDQEIFAVEKANRGRIIGQLFDTYILIEYDDELLLIDQHAAHERLLYDKLLKEFTAETITSQTLLIPYERQLDYDAASILSTKISALKALGIDASLDNNKLTVYAIPMILTEIDLEGFVLSLCEEAKNLNFITDIDIFKNKISKIACKMAIKGGDKLNDDEIKYVLKYIFTNDIPLQCPHGRPTVVKVTRTEIEKLFRRIV